TSPIPRCALLARLTAWLCMRDVRRGIEGGEPMGSAAGRLRAARGSHEGTIRNVLAAGAALLLALAQATIPAKADDAFKVWLADLWPEAQAFDISRQTFDAAFRGVEPDLRLPDLVIPGRKQAPRGQAEFTRPPQAYINSKQLARLAAAGRALRAEHAGTLEEIERQFGVEGEAVLAIWGRETAFGAHQLPHYAIRVLATQAYLGRRKEMFRNELLHALKLIDDGSASIEQMRSSWAGAIGLPQVMPSEFHRLAYAPGGDGRKDIWTSIPDALATIARQLQGKGWVYGQTWGYEVRLPQSVDCSLEGPENARPLSAWAAMGVERTFGRQFPKHVLQAEAYVIAPGGAHGPALLVVVDCRCLMRRQQL